MLAVDLSLPNPRQVNDREPAWLIAMTKQDIIPITPISERLDRSSEKQVARRQFALKFVVQALRLSFRRVIPARRQHRTICGGVIHCGETANACTQARRA